MNIVKRLPVLGLLLLPALLHAHEGMITPSEPPLGASAAFDSHGRLWLVDAADGHVRLRHSDDHGKTLSKAVDVNALAEPIYAEGENRPKLAFGPQEQLYVSWSQPRAKPWTGFVRFARSMDQGVHFSTPITVHHDRAEITHRFDALAVDGKGRIVIAWIDKRDQQVALDHKEPYPGAAIYYSWSGDAGASFVPERKLLDQSCECCRIALAHTPQGAIAAFFRAIYGDNIRDHAYAVLRTDGQPSHVERASFSDWQIAGCPHHGPGLSIGSDGVRHAVWYEGSHGPTIWYGQLDPGHPSRHALKIAGAGAAHADVIVQQRNVWLAWNQVSAQGYQLMLRHSADNGRHFDTARAIAQSKVAVAAPQLLEDHHRVYVAWNTASGFRMLEAKP